MQWQVSDELQEKCRDIHLEARRICQDRDRRAAQKNDRHEEAEMRNLELDRLRQLIQQSNSSTIGANPTGMYELSCESGRGPLWLTGISCRHTQGTICGLRALHWLVEEFRHSTSRGGDLAKVRW